MDAEMPYESAGRETRLWALSLFATLYPHPNRAITTRLTLGRRQPPVI